MFIYGSLFRRGVMNSQKILISSSERDLKHVSNTESNETIVCKRDQSLKDYIIFVCNADFALWL